MNVELTRFRVRQGKAGRVDEWMAFLNEHMDEVLVTLDGEKMYVETILRETLGGEEYLYWYSVQGEGGQAVETSTHWIDEKHMAYWRECIDPEFTPVDLAVQAVMIPEKVRTAMN